MQFNYQPCLKLSSAAAYKLAGWPERSSQQRAFCKPRYKALSRISGGSESIFQITTIHVSAPALERVCSSCNGTTSTFPWRSLGVTHRSTKYLEVLQGHATAQKGLLVHRKLEWAALIYMYQYTKMPFRYTNPSLMPPERRPDCYGIGVDALLVPEYIPAVLWLCSPCRSLQQRHPSTKHGPAGDH